MNLDHEKNTIINAIYRSVNCEDKRRNELYIKTHIFKLIVDFLLIIYIINSNMTLYFKVIFITILLLSDLQIVLNYIYIYTKKDCIGIKATRNKNALKLIDKYQKGILVKFATVWNFDLYGYHAGKYKIEMIDYNSFRNIRQINDVFIGILKNNDIVFLSTNILIEEDSQKYCLIEYLKKKSIKVEIENVEVKFIVSDIYAKLTSEMKNTEIKLLLNKILNFCSKLSYVIIILIIWKIILF